MNKIEADNEKEICIQIIDTSSDVLFNNEKSHNELLKTINATVNHELRNPLNSIYTIN